MPLRGRAEEMAALSARLEAATHGKGGVVLLEGPAGIGKTRLLAEVATTARGAGFAVAELACDERPGIPLLTRLSPLCTGELSALRAADVADLERHPDRRYWLLDRLRAGFAERVRRGPVL